LRTDAHWLIPLINLASSAVGTIGVVASRTFFASSVVLYCDGGVGEAGVLLKFAGVVVSLVVAAADWTVVGLGTVCITDTLRF